MEGFTFEQKMDRLTETGYLSIEEVHIQEVEVKTDKVTEFVGKRLQGKKLENTKVLKKVYQVHKDKEVMFLGASGKYAVASQGNRIELCSTEREMRNTGFAIVRTGFQKRDPNHRSELTFKLFSEILPRDFAS